jgi:hypothetical protein
MRIRAFLCKLRQHRGGLAVLEFGLALPIVLPVGLYGIEVSNYALVQMKLSQMALTLSDNASRVGVDNTLNMQELREYDVNEVLQGVRLQGANLDIGRRARITLSSLEVNAKGGQYIHWQRCLGEKSGTGYDSSYGNEGDGANSATSFTGMGESGAKVTAPPGAAVMFVEMNYDYKPLVSGYLVGTSKMKFVASFIVRDDRDLSKSVTNPSPESTPMTCDLHAA